MKWSAIKTFTTQVEIILMNNISDGLFQSFFIYLCSSPPEPTMPWEGPVCLHTMATMVM